MKKALLSWALLSWALMALVGAVQAAESSSARLGNVQLKGALGERLAMMLERHVIAMDVDYITAPFSEKTETKEWWQTEFWGKWMHAAMPYYRYTRSERLLAAIDRGLDRMLASQEPSGYIGNYPDELRCGEGWDVWGIKYTMLGLLHYYDAAPDRARAAKALAACRRLCDYLIAELGPDGKRDRELWQTGNWSGFASSSVLEPVMWLYQRTQEQKYLDFATYIVKGMTEPELGPRLLDLALQGVSVADRNGYGNADKADGGGGYVMKHNRTKAYEMMSCYQGLLEYYEVTGRKELFEAAKATADDIIKTEINLAGGCACSEAWYHGARKQHLPYCRLQETCVTTTWMRLCEKLLELTGDPKWADQLERTFYNAYLAALKADGSEFAAYTPLSGSRFHGHDHCYMHINCCNANGPRGFLCFLKEFFHATADGGMVVNFYSSALMEDTLPKTGKRVAFEMYSRYPRMASARLVSHTEGVGKVPLKLRIPAWSETTRVRLNGKELPGVKSGAYFTIDHEWRLGDVVEVDFDLVVIAHKQGHQLAFTSGPVLLARDSRFHDGDLHEPWRAGWISVDGQRLLYFSAVRSPSDRFGITFSATLPIGVHAENPEGALPSTVFFCDYASAGNTWARDDFYQTWFTEEYHQNE